MGTKYLHCGNCWGILGEIPASDPKRIFDMMDCGWPCSCGRYNVSSDGSVVKLDYSGNQHWIYVQGDKRLSLLERIPDVFDFEKFEFPFTNPIWNPQENN